jgi:spore maturation protein CgeB
LEGERVLQLRLRDFEVPMSGGFYMVEYAEELEDFFEVGKEIVCYEGPDDLVNKIRYYLAHEVEREAIRKAGHERALLDHTWKRRFEKAFREMGLA